MKQNQPTMEKIWHIREPIMPEVVQSLQGYPDIFQQILYNRKYTTSESASDFLEARQPDGTDPGNLMGIPEAIDRLGFAIRHHEPVAIYGDYDADGVTATALMVSALEKLGADVVGYIPNRFDEGYGLNTEAIHKLHEDGIRLIVTVDCGIRSIQETEYARRLGLDLIISDHHHPGKEIPPAVSIINPKQAIDSYPEKDLAGVGLAYKLASALYDQNDLADEFLDLVALGTVADLAPLVGENRALVRRGLECIRQPRRQGIQSLIGVSGLTPQKIKSSNISYALGPRLNAAGRLESAQDALSLLLTKDASEAGRLAQRLEIQNRQRQQITQEIQAHAEEFIQSDEEERFILLAVHPEYNPGVVGLVASRLSEVYYLPAIVGNRGEAYTRASCRSIPEFHITEALDQCADLLERHGGHAAAAGFTVKNERLPELVERLRSIAATTLSDVDLRPKITADIEIPLVELKPELLPYLKLLQPTGYKNPQAYFVSRDVYVKNCRPVGRDNAHLKLILSDGWITYNAIAFRQGHWYEQMPPHIDILYAFEENEYMGRTSLQLNVRDLKPAR